MNRIRHFLFEVSGVSIHLRSRMHLASERPAAAEVARRDMSCCTADRFARREVTATVEWKSRYILRVYWMIFYETKARMFICTV